MSETDTSKSGTPEWTIFYHAPGKFKGRGEFLRLMLEDKGITDYVDTDADLYGPEGLMDCFRGSSEAVKGPAKAKDQATALPLYPSFFPPAIWHRPKNNKEEEVFVNQVGACMIYLGEQLGYAPASSAERARADMILLNSCDYIAEGRLSFHPVKNSMSYNDQKEEGDKCSKEFSNSRMLFWLHHFNKIVRYNNQHFKRGGAIADKIPIAGGPRVTYADFALFHVLDATSAQFNSELYEHAWDKADVPELKEYYHWIKERPNLQAYFRSDRCARK